MASVLDLVKHYQHSIEKYPNDEQKILKCIDKLFNLGVTVQHLQETGVGRTVNALRKEPGDVGQAARALVYKWKLMVAAEESDQETEQSNANTNTEHDHGDDSETNTKKSEKKNKEYECSETKIPKVEEKYHKHNINGDHSGHKRKYQSSEEEHDIKKSRHLNSNDNGYKVKTELPIKKVPSDSEDDNQYDSSQSDSESDESQSSEEELKHRDKKEKEYGTSLKHSQSDFNDKHSKKYDKTKEMERYSKHSNIKHDERTSSKQNSHSSHRHKNSEEKSHNSEKKEHRPSEKNKVSSSKLSSRHSSEKHRSSSSEVQRSNNPDKHKSSSEKHKSSSSSEKYKSSGSDKHKNHLEHSSSKSEKSGLSKNDKQSSDKEVLNDKHKISESKSSSSKDKLNATSKEKSRYRQSSKDKEHSHKSNKKHSSSSDTNSRSSEPKIRSDKNDDKRSKKSMHTSSSSSNKTAINTSKSKEELPKRKSISNSEDEDGIDCGSGASFAEALGMISPAKPKKKSLLNNSISPSNSSIEDLSPASLLSPSAKLAPLPSIEISALPEISPNYRPRPPPKFLPHFTDEDAMNSGISSKNQRTKVYSGNKVIGKIPSLYEMCVNILQEHIDALEFTGGVPYEILKPVVDRATPQQLSMLEHYNPYLMEDTDHLWQKFCEKNFRNKKRHEMETWREMYMRCLEEQEIRLKSLTAHIRTVQEAKKAPIKQTKMAYVDSVVKPPRNVAKKQAQHGTAFAATASPAARVASLAAAPNVLKSGRPAPVPSVSTSSSFKPKKAPLMQKALQFMRGRKR